MADIPESLLRRSAEAKAKATGRPVEEILAEMKGEAPPEPAGGESADAPAEAPAEAAAAPAASGNGGEADPEKAAAAAKLPDHLLRRSAQARAKVMGRPVEAVLAEMKGEPAPSGGGAAAPAPSGGGGAATAVAAKPAAPVIPEGVRTQRLLTVVKAKAIQQVKSEPTDKVSTWPHLVAVEFVALLVVTAALVVFSVFQDAPLLELANPNEQPNPSKAPWYFLGLQELLSYFDPQIAGVLIPGLGLAGLAIIPYIDRNPSVRPSDRKFAIMIFTFFVMASAITTIIGSFYRGPGFNFSFPWRDGIFFDL
ncbi:MAG: menaquinol-cytochrome c reductase cytochrome b subunit [Acidimicrobiia bacterium]|nr:menaquinol-cytochrome c reductase cytochrome b subunit [Acidimicrobiia bacterium]